LAAAPSAAAVRGLSNHLAHWEQLYNLAEQRGAAGRGLGGAGVGAVPVSLQKLGSTAAPIAPPMHLQSRFEFLQQFATN